MSEETKKLTMSLTEAAARIDNSDLAAFLVESLVSAMRCEIGLWNCDLNQNLNIC